MMLQTKFHIVWVKIEIARGLQSFEEIHKKIVITLIIENSVDMTANENWKKALPDLLPNKEFLLKEFFVYYYH